MTAPVVSIGLPVFNGEKYLKEALDSILAQTFSDFELLISDNGSTDRTREICTAYADKDGRIRYSRNEMNVGAGRNHNVVFELSSGKYFMWSAYDDAYAPEFVSRCVDVLEHDPSVVLCYPIIIHTDELGRHIRKISIEKGKSEKAHVRFRGLIRLDHTCEQIYGLIRSDVLRKTKLHGNYTDSDRTLLSELSLYGRFHEVPEPLFFHRVHPQSSTTVYSDWRKRMLWFDPSLEGRTVFPHWIQCCDYFRTIHRSSLGLFERVQCYFHMGGWLILYGKGLVKDVLVAAISIVRGIFKARPPAKIMLQKSN